MASSDFSKDIRSRISAPRALYRPLRWPSEPPIFRDLDRSLTSPSLRAVAVYAGDDNRGSYSISATVAAFAGNEAARPSLSPGYPVDWPGALYDATSRSLLVRPAGSPLVPRWGVDNLSDHFKNAGRPTPRSQANELRVVARGRTSHLPDNRESRPELIATSHSVWYATKQPLSPIPTPQRAGAEPHGTRGVVGDPGGGGVSDPQTAKAKTQAYTPATSCFPGESP